MNIKLILIGLAVAAIGGILWHDHWISKKYQATKAELVQANATITAERAAREHELKIAKEASDGYQADLKRLEAERVLEPVPVVRLCRKPATVSASGPAAVGSDAASTPNDVEAAQTDIGPDIGPALIEYGVQCEANMLQLDRLRQWVESR
jgi:hypothetical protein